MPASADTARINAKLTILSGAIYQITNGSKNKNSETNESGINITLNITTATTRYLKFEKTRLKLFAKLQHRFYYLSKDRVWLCS